MCVMACFAAVAHGALQHGDIVVAGGLPIAPVGYDGWLRTYSRLGQLGAELRVAAPPVNLAVHGGSVFAKDVNSEVVRVEMDGSLVSPGYRIRRLPRSKRTIFALANLCHL